MSLEPSDAEIIADAIEARLLVLHTNLVGQIVTYDATKQVADIQLVVNQPLELSDGSILSEELPILPNVKIRWPRAGGYTCHLPLAKGDWVAIHFSEAALDFWRTSGQVAVDVGDRRRFSLAHCWAVPGLAPDDDPIASDDAPATGEGVINGPGTFRIGGLAQAVFVALAPLVDQAVADIVAAFNAHTHPTGVGPSGTPTDPLDEPPSTAATKLKAQ